MNCSRIRTCKVLVTAIVWIIAAGLQLPAIAGGKSPCSIEIIEAGNGNSFAIDGDGTLWAWGRNHDGKLGVGGAAASFSPLRVAMIENVVAVSAGRFHSLAVDADGTAWAWGSNYRGELGNGTLTNADKPQVVNGLSDVIAVAAGNTQSMALTSDGTVWAWGYNSQGVLGTGTMEFALTSPLQVRGPNGIGLLTDVIDIAVGGDGHFQAVRSNGTVWGWGQNSNGQLGIGIPTPSTVLVKAPRQVKGPGGIGFFEGAVSVGAGTKYSLVLKADGTIWGWGVGMGGQLGTGMFERSFTPIQTVGPDGVGQMTNAVEISVGTHYSLARTADGAMWGWGWNSDGQLGDGNLGNYVVSPGRVKGPNDEGFLAGVESISAGWGHAMAVGEDGTTWVWGFAFGSTPGYLGNGTPDTSTTPVPVIDDCGCLSCEELLNTIELSTIANAGIQRSLLAKANAACSALDRGRLIAAGNILRALLQALDAQTCKAIDTATADQISVCVETFADQFDLNTSINGKIIRARCSAPPN